MDKNPNDVGIYKTKTVLELTGFKRDKFNQWLAKRIIVPVKPPKRKGDRSLFSYNNLVQFLIVERLADFGINIAVGGGIAIEATSQRIDVDGDAAYLLIDIDYPSDAFLLDDAHKGDSEAYIVVDYLVFENRVNAYLEGAG